MTQVHTLAVCQALGHDAPLAPVRDEFLLPEALLYLDDNTLVLAEEI